MKKILDLSTFVEDTMDITLPDGRKAIIGKPSQGMVIKLMTMQDLNENSDVNELMEALNELVYLILSNNTNGAMIKREEVQEMSLEAKTAITTAYTEFVGEVQNDPNSKSLPCR